MIDADLVRRLVARQFPQWAELPVTPVEPGGWDNRTFRLGSTMSVRLPSAERYTAQVEKEQLWLPRIAPDLPLPISLPLAKGTPDMGYPWPWSVCQWIEGETAEAGRIGDTRAFAIDLAGFLTALQAIDASDGPVAGPHNFHRGGSLATYDSETRKALEKLSGQIDTGAAVTVWEAALASTWKDRPVWVHGDVSVGNLLVRNGRLAAVIDFGGLGVGDPACDLAIAWTFLKDEGRAAFRAALPLDSGTWARGRGWTLWKALIVWAGLPGANPAGRANCQRIIQDLIAEHRFLWGARA